MDRRAGTSSDERAASKITLGGNPQPENAERSNAKATEQARRILTDSLATDPIDKRSSAGQRRIDRDVDSPHDQRAQTRTTARKQTPRHGARCRKVGADQT